jgi:GAF domain-containing protein/AmiR/NasT family two-component response regulator
MSDSSIRVLVVDDEESLRMPLADWLAAEHGYLVETAASGLEVLEMLAADGCFDVILLDYLLPPPYNGITLMEEVKSRCRDASMDFIIFTGWGLEPQVGVEALKAGAYRYLSKPFDWEELAILIQSIVETRRTREKLEATSREKAWLESLLQVSQSVNSTLELDQVLELILDEMKRVVVYDSASIQRITDAGLQIVACRGFSDPDELIGYIFPPSDEFPNYRVWQSRRPRIEYDLHATYHARHVRGWLGAPLIYRNEAIGVITLDSQTPGFYDEEDARMATIFANQAAIAMENARLFSEAERQLSELDKLHRASGVMTSKLALDQVLQEVVALASEVAGSENTSLVLVDNGGELVDGVEQVDDAFQGIPPLHERARPEGKTHQVIRSGEPAIFHQVDPDADHNPFLLQAGVASYVGLPLKAKDRVVGVLFVHSLSPGIFEDRIPLLMTFANQAAIAIENARLHHQTQKRAEALHRLLEIGQQITRVTDRPKGVLETIARMACQVTGAECAVIYPYLAEKRVYDKDNVASFGLHRAFIPSAKPREYGRSVTARIIGEPNGTCIVPDVAQDAEWGSKGKPLRESPFIIREGIQAFAGMRLDFGAEPVGVLFANFRSPHKWADDELDLIDLFANQAAVAIWNARLYGRTSQKLEQKVVELQTVGEINQLITSTLNLGEVLPLILDKAMELVDVQHGVLQLIDDETGELVIQLRKGLTLVPLERPRLKPGEGITGKAAQEKRSIVVHDVTQPPWRDIYYEFWPGTRSELAVPLLIGERCIGVLNFEHSEPGYFSEDEREIVEGMATQAAIAIQNAQRYDELEQAKDALAATEAVAWMGLFGSSWAHGVTQKTSAVRNYLTVLADYLPQDGKVQELLVSIEDAVKAIQGIPIVQKLPSESRVAATLDLDVALRDQVRRWCRSHSEVELVFEMQCEGIRTHIDKEWLDVAMEKLINNALRAMPDGGQLKIASTYRAGKVEVKVVDTGYGISERIRPYFLKKQIPQEFTSAGGTGIGALIARYIFRAFGGDLDLLWSEGGRGTGLRITLPATPIEML